MAADSSTTFQRLCRLTLERQPAPEQLFLRMAGLVVRVQSNSRALLAELHRYFEEFVWESSPEDILIHAIETTEVSFNLPFREKPPDPGKQRVKEDFVDLPGGRIVKKRLTGMHFLFNGRINLACGPCLANSNQVVNFINNRFLERRIRQGGLLGHAAAVRFGTRGLAMAGFSGSGKSSLALHVLTRGASFVSNDRLIIDRLPEGLRMFGIPKHPRVNPGTLLTVGGLEGVLAAEARDVYSQMDEAALWALEEKHDLLIGETFGRRRFCLEAPMEGLLVLNWQRGAGRAAIRPVDMAQRHDLLTALVKAPGLFFLPAPGADPLDWSRDRYVERLSDCQCFEVTGGVDFKAAADFCDAFLRGERT